LPLSRKIGSEFVGSCCCSSEYPVGRILLLLATATAAPDGGVNFDVSDGICGACCCRKKAGIPTLEAVWQVAAAVLISLACLGGLREDGSTTLMVDTFLLPNPRRRGVVVVVVFVVACVAVVVPVFS